MTSSPSGRLYKALVKGEPQAFPQFTSCSPGWVKYLEHFYPEYIPNLSSAKSPQQMFGAVIKTYYAKANNIDPNDIVTVALMPKRSWRKIGPESNSYWSHWMVTPVIFSPLISAQLMGAAPR